MASQLWWIDAGFIGILFGAGNPCCANYEQDNDGGWFAEHIAAYNENPISFPVVHIRKTEEHPQMNTLRKEVSVCFRHGSIIATGWEGYANVTVTTPAGKMLLSRILLAGEPSLLEKRIVSGIYFVTVRNGTFRQTTSVFLPCN